MRNSDEVNKKKKYSQLAINSFLINQKACQSLYQTLNSHNQLNVREVKAIDPFHTISKNSGRIVSFEIVEAWYYAGEMKVVI